MSDASLLKAASDVAAVLKVIVEMSDDVTRGQSPLDTQGRLLKLQSSIQKSRPRVVKLVDELCNQIEAETTVQEGSHFQRRGSGA